MTSTRQKRVVKILVLGPCKAGKSAIATFLGEVADWEALKEYRPTKGVRIVEFECQDMGFGDGNGDVDVELWDCSGDEKYRDCWPALLEDAGAAILVANPEEDKGEDLLVWLNEFILKGNISQNRIMVVLNEKGDKSTNSGNISNFKVIPGLSPAEFVGCNLRHEGEQLRTKFGEFLQRMVHSD